MRTTQRLIRLTSFLILIAVVTLSCTSTSQPIESSTVFTSTPINGSTQKTIPSLIPTHTTITVSPSIPSITSLPTIPTTHPTTSPPVTNPINPTTNTTTTPTNTIPITVGAATVTRVIDGDTIEVSIDDSLYKVRYIGIDTPETYEYFGQDATNKNSELISGKNVWLEKDISETDSFGRLLRYVYVDNLMINAELVRLGYAQAHPYPPDIKYQNLFDNLEQEAKTAQLGMWALSLKIVSITSPIEAGSYAVLIAEATPNSQCTITVYYNSGPSSASGLGAKTADSNGNVSWEWKIGSNTSPGEYKIIVTSSLNNHTVSKTVYFTVQ